jgi:hypothetical protein
MFKDVALVGSKRETELSLESFSWLSNWQSTFTVRKSQIRRMFVNLLNFQGTKTINNSYKIYHLLTKN